MRDTRRSGPDRLRPIFRFSNRLESIQIRAFGVSGFSLLQRTPVLALETTGRRSGKRRHAPVAYWQARDRYYVGGGRPA